MGLIAHKIVGLIIQHAESPWNLLRSEVEKLPYAPTAKVLHRKENDENERLGVRWGSPGSTTISIQR